MNHLGDTNKMVDTPRTDAAWKTLHTIYELAGEMKRMERELNAANDRIQSLIQERDRANRLAEWKWNLRDEFQLLLGTDKIEEGIEAVKELKRRIRRLEEAGDFLSRYLREMPYASDYLAQVDERILRISNWRRANEDNL